MFKMRLPSDNISKLDLSNQNLTSIPAEVFSLKNLKTLKLSNNNISVIPREITKLRRLEKLDLSNNKLSNFYAKVCQLPKLKVLNLNNNYLKTIPKQIKDLNELRVLSIANNELTSLPKEFAELKRLRKLNISKNNFELFPHELTELTELKVIWLNNLAFKTFPINLIFKKLNKLKAIYCFGHIVRDDSIDTNYLHLTRIKGNSFPDLIKLKSRINRSENEESNRENIKNQVKKKIFISYSHQDLEWLHRVKTNLKVLQFNDHDFEVWDDNKIHSGEKWKNEIEKALSESKIAILIISTNFLASDFIQENELPPLFKKAEEDGTTILPLIIGHCRFTKDKNLKDFQAVNSPSKPLSSCTKAEVEKILVKLTNDVERCLLS